MATVPAPGTQAAAGAVTSALLNGFRDNMNFGTGIGANTRPYCFAFQNTAQTLGAGATTGITLDGEIEDTDAMHTNPNTFFTVITAGVYLVEAQIAFPSTASGHDDIHILQNGTIVSQVQANFIATTHRVGSSKLIRCAAADTIGLEGFSTAGGLLTGGANFTFLQAMWMRA